ncbi:septum formation initiator family protein [Staphylococcus argenteus]|nr:septum formation initiator family protein [Staphylococcus argenteus]
MLMHKNEKRKKNNFKSKKNEEIALKEKLNNLNDKDYIEKIARDDYYLSNKGEVIFRLPNDKGSSNSDSSKKIIRK